MQCVIGRSRAENKPNSDSVSYYACFYARQKLNGSRLRCDELEMKALNVFGYYV